MPALQPPCDASRLYHRPAAWLPLLLAVLAWVSACGGAGPANTPEPQAPAAAAPLLPQVVSPGLPEQAPPLDAAGPAVPAPPALASVDAGVFNGGLADPGLLMLLVPDGQSIADPRVTAWIDAASEVGTRVAPITDAQFLAQAPATALRYAGLVLPDQLHTVASDGLVAAVRDYVTRGGRALLVYDFAALTLNGNGQPVYPIPRARMSDLAGVDYVLYDALLDRTVGLGPVTAMRSTLRELLVAPGKSMPWGDVPQAAAPDGKPQGRSMSTPLAGAGVMGAAGLQEGQALYLRASPRDPGGVSGFDPQQFHKLAPHPLADRLRAGTGTVRPRTLKFDFGQAYKAAQVPGATRAQPASTQPGEPAQADAQAPMAAAIDTLHAYHGYLLGNLVYPSYVTAGTFTGVTLATSPQFGLVAGIHQVGLGRVLFVNLPLGYLKGRTDALPMHGFLHYFMQHVVQGARLSTMPNAVAGLTLDWHLDSMAAQAPTLALEAAGIFNTASFSMEMTAGPDTIVPGDGLGWNLDNNPVAQQLLRRLDARGHAIGSHGGWIHDYYGDGATEDNADAFLPYLQANKAAVDRAVGRAMRSYSAPQGNNPLWAMNWLEQQGVVGAYFGGHTGLGATRQYRDGALLNPALWVFPVTPQGVYATFEEFQAFNIPKQEVITWYRDMVDFSLARNTSRLVYMHPPGANQWRDVVQNLLAYGQKKGAGFAWYTMPRLAGFMAARNQVSWAQTVLANGNTRFNASHPQTLAEMVWMLPKARYLKPTVGDSAAATVSDAGGFWLVRARAVTQLQFQARPNTAFAAG